MVSQANHSKPECVVLIHGLGRSSKSFLATSLVLEQAGYVTSVVDYPSRDHGIETLVEQLNLSSFFDGRYRTVHFVTHSMGGILLRLWLRDNAPKQLGKVVMLGPPNQGSGVIDSFRGLAAFRWFIGPAGLELSTDADSTPNSLPPIKAPIGIIAGTLSLMPLSDSIVGEASDGKVSVESTKLSEMTDHITIPVGHTFMMNSPRVIAQVISFFKNGKFAPPYSTRAAIRFLRHVTNQT